MAVHEAHTKPAGADAMRPLRLEEIRGSLTTTRIGTKLHYLSETGSTNTFARALAEQGASDGEVVIAERQTQGRGRLGRPWVSPPYLNLYLSVILRPALPAAEAPQITLMAAVALADTAAAFLPSPPTIKWPNDIMLEGKKLAGILTESSCASERLEFVILGLGVNLNFSAALMPEPIRQRATSLLIATGEPVRRETFLRRLIHDLDRCYGILQESGLGALAPRWEARFALKDRRVRVEMTDGVIFGTARGIDRDGALIVESGKGQLRRVLAGDVVPVED